MNTIKFHLAATLALVLMMSSCNNQETTEDTTATENETTTEQTQTENTQTEETQATATSDTVRLEIHGNDQMEYNKDRLTVKAGQVVVLTLKHVGEMPENAMGHNWVLLKKGADKAAFAQDAVNAKENDYIPDGRTKDIIAHTEMLGGGESDQITFKAPDKGIYTYICSFPGHYVKMSGKFIVE